VSPVGWTARSSTMSGTSSDMSHQVTSNDYFQASSGAKMRMIDKSSDSPDPACADFLYWYPA